MAFWLVFLVVTNVSAQIGQPVVEGDVYSLGVSEVPGHTYEWKIFEDYTLQTEAGPSMVVFLSGNMGATVPVKWLVKGTYYFTVTSTNFMGCMNLKVGSIQVIEYLKQVPSIHIAVDHNPICPNGLATFTATAMNRGIDPTYQWYKNDIKVGQNSPVYRDSTLVTNDRIYCSLISVTYDKITFMIRSEVITVTVLYIDANFSLTENVNHEKGKIQFHNHSVGADYYYWDFGNGETSYDFEPAVTYYKDSTYLIMLAASNSIGCLDTTAIHFDMLFRDLYIPNAFAPDFQHSDGGLFKPVGANLKSYKIEVYDNWGHLLWESSALDSEGRPAESWDGTCNGNRMPQGTYMWKAYGVFSDGTVWLGSDIGKGEGRTMGTVTLLR